MGGIKSKVFGETEFKEDKFKNEILKDKQINNQEVEELQEEEKTSNTIEELSINYKEPQNFQFTSSLSTLSTGSFQDLNENCLTVRNDNEHLETLKISEINNNNSKSSSHHFPLLDLSLLETKHQQKIRPYTLFNQNRINNTKNNIQNKENNNNSNKMETIPTVTSFQPPNHLQKNQYFRSFRMASRRIFNPNVNNDNKNKQPASNDSVSDKIKKNATCKSTENMTAFKPQPKPRASNELNKTATFIANNNNNNITNNAIIAQSNLNDSNKNETKLINLDTKIIKLDNLEISNNNNYNNDVIINNSNKSNITTNILENNNLEKQQPIINKAVPNLKSKSTVDFLQTKHIPFIQTSATSTKLTEAKLASKNSNKSFRNQNFTSAGYFNPIKKRFSNQLNKETLSETVNTTNNKETEESNMLNSFDPQNVIGKLNNNEHLTGSSSNVLSNAIRQSEKSIPVLPFNTNSTSSSTNPTMRSASVSEMSKHFRNSNRESVTSTSTDWEALNENQNKNENLIDDLKKQIESLNKQLEHLGREDSKIINELSDKIENLAKMNVNIISAIGTQQESNKFRASFFGRPRQSQTSEAYYARLKQQNDILLLQQRQIEQLRKDLLNSFISNQPQAPTPQPNIPPNIPPQTTTFTYPDASYYNNQSYNGYSRPTISNSYSYSANPYPNSNYYFSTPTPTAPTPTMTANPNITSPTFSTSSHYHPTHSHAHSHPHSHVHGHNYVNPNSPYYVNRNSGYGESQQYFYYPANHPSFHHQQQQQHHQQQRINSAANSNNIFYDPNSGQYFQYQTRPQNAQYIYNQNLNGIYANLYAYRKAQQATAQAMNETNSFETQYDTANSKETVSGNVIITEVSDDEDIDYSSKYDGKKDYVDAISLNEEEI